MRSRVRTAFLGAAFLVEVSAIGGIVLAGLSAPPLFHCLGMTHRVISVILLRQRRRLAANGPMLVALGFVSQAGRHINKT